MYNIIYNNKPQKSYSSIYAKNLKHSFFKNFNKKTSNQLTAENQIFNFVNIFNNKQYIKF